MQKSKRLHGSRSKEILTRRLFSKIEEATAEDKLQIEIFQRLIYNVMKKLLHWVPKKELKQL